MKFITFSICIIGLLFSINSSAQFKLKTLDDVIVSMNEGETIEKYNSYLEGYFSRIEMLEPLTDKGRFAITNVQDKQYLQGQGVNADQKNVLFRIEVKTDQTGLIISRVKTTFEAQACVAISCVACTFNDDSSCACQGEGTCDHKLSMKK